MAENVWRSIAHRDDIHVRLSRHLPGEVGGGVLVRKTDGNIWILLDAHLPAHERRAVLAHELEHLARGSVRFVGSPTTWDSVIVQEERRVDRNVARRLVPIDDLRAFVAARCSTGESVTAADVAEAFDVPVWVARCACEMAA